MYSNIKKKQQDVTTCLHTACVVIFQCLEDAAVQFDLKLKLN